MTKGMGLLLALSILLSGIIIAPVAYSADVEIVVNAPLVVHTPIRIDSDAGFNATNGVSGGNGTIWAPWVIENWDINGTGAGYCIYVGNTTEYFEVKNCSLYNGSFIGNYPFYIGYGLILYKVGNGTLNNNTVFSNEGGIGLTPDCFSNMIINNNITDNGVNGISLEYSSKNTIKNNTVTNHGDEGILLYINCSENTIRNNNIVNNTKGVVLDRTDNTTVVENKISSSSSIGIHVLDSAYNTVYHNNFLNNTNQSFDNGTNVWDNGYPYGGNFWDNYTGNDSFYGANQDMVGADGIGDTNYTISGGPNEDNYPLMAPWTGQPLGYEMALTTISLNYTPTGTNVSIAEVMEITWNETMNWTSVENAFNYTDGVTVWNSTNGSWTHFPAVNISRFTPTNPYDYETQYNVTVNCSATDIVGNQLDQNMSGVGGEWPEDILIWNFTTVDEAPFLVSSSPAPGQVGVDPHMPIILTFSEPMNETSVQEAFSYQNATLTFTIGNGTDVWNGAGTEFSFSPDPILETNQTYTIGLNGSMARDVDGRIMGSNSTWSFMTWAEPPSPKVISTNPLEGSVGVSVTSYITLGFDIVMNVNNVEDAFSYTDGNNTWDVEDGTVDWFAGNTIFSFQPTDNLNFDSTYTVIIETNATSIYGNNIDGNGNGIAEPVDNFVLSFSTVLEPPNIVSSFPAADTIDVLVTTPAIYINFSKAMDITSVTNGISIFPNTGFIPSFSASAKNLTLVLSDNLIGATQYRVTILGTVEDSRGVRLDGDGNGVAGDKYNLLFYTEGTIILENPTIISIFPSDNATIPIESVQVQITFSQEMNRTSVENAFSFMNGTSEINGTFVWRGDGAAVRFSVVGELEYNLSYSVSLAGSAKDINGLTLANSTTWNYITEAEEASSSPWDWLIYVAIIILVVIVIMLYLANRSLRMNLRRSNVKLKRAMKKYNFTEDDLRKKKKTPKDEVVLDIEEIQEMPEKIPEPDITEAEIVPEQDN